MTKLKGKRRRPYAVRTSSIMEYIVFNAPMPNDASAYLSDHGFKCNKSMSSWKALVDANTQKYAQKASEQYGVAFASEFRQVQKYVAYFEKSDEAHKFLAEYNSGNVIKEDRRYIDSPTFLEMYEKWVAYKKSLKKCPGPSTWKNYKHVLNKMSSIWGRKFSSLRPSELQDILNENNHFTVSTIGVMRAIFKGVCKYAFVNHYVDEDISEYLVFEWTDTDEHIHKAYTDDEIQYLWDHLDTPNVDILLIYIYTGMRPSELLEIRNENIHLEERYMTGGMKTDAGKDRIIPINDKIFPFIEKRYNSEKEYLIYSVKGMKYSYYTFYQAIYHPLIKELGLDHKAHDGRHTFATLMDRAGANEVCTKLIMGHSFGKDITKGIYTHKTLQELLEEVNKI